ncbi:hypothetical protein FGB62_3g137 [Gracilaria domingensis]|nr:hypothetical protein FGB62_3g137 [Gracilaria domingensis]
MTAESCLGYLIRKTRDHQHLTRLTTSVVTAAKSSHLDAQQQNYAANGLGTSLFEAIRLPSGRLHSRASVVVAAAFQALVKPSEPVACNVIDPCFSVLSTCFASLCRYVTNEKDARAVTAIFVTSGEARVSENLCTDAVRVVCLLRNWIHFGGKNVSELLGVPFLQRILNFLSKSARKWLDDSRVVFESLAAMCSVSRHAPSTFRQKVARSSIAPLLAKIAESGAPQSARAALYVVLDVYKDDWDFSRLVALEHGVATLCDRIAQDEVPEEVETPDMRTSRVSAPALSSALTFIEVLDRFRGSKNVEVVRLKCPTLEARIMSLLRLHAEKGAGGMTESSVRNHEQVLALVLRYLSRVIVPGSAHLLGTASVDHNLSFKLKASFLRASCFQSLKTESCPGELPEADLITLVRSLIHDVKETTALSDMLQALDFFFRVSSDNHSLEKGLNQGDIERLRETLVENLSSSDQTVRILCAANLANISTMQSRAAGREGMLSETTNTEQSLASKLVELQESFQIRDSDRRGLFDVMRSVFETSQEMSMISTKQKFVQEIARLVQNSRKVDDELLRAVVQFSLGILRTPLRLVWKDAASLLRFAAARDEKLTMSLVMRQLLVCKEDILDYCRRRQSGGDEDIHVEDESGDQEAETNQSTTEPHRTFEGEKTNRGTETRGNRGSKRRRAALVSESSVKKRKRSDAGLIARAWEEKSLTADILHDRLLETSLFRVGSVGSETFGSDLSTTDSPTVVVELAKSLCEEPKYSMKCRVDIISIYLSLDPSLFSQKRGAGISLAFTNLLEKLGGLKSCETDTALENRMRSRLLSDLTIPNCELQAAVLRCLCVSRSPWIKPYRDSLVRLTQSRSFREELALMTEGMFAQPGDKQKGSDEELVIVDLLTRICFSKLKGKWSKKDSQRSAVLSFLAAKLPWDIAFPKLTSLVLKPLGHVIGALENDINFDLSSLTMPEIVVQKAILGSVEAIVKQCRMSLPSSSWKQLTIATLIVMRNAGVGPHGQSMRSRSLRLCSEMYRIRPSETAFCTGRVMRTLKDAGFNTETNRAIKKTPAFIQFLGAVLGSDALEGKQVVLADHLWSMEYCFGVIKGKEVDTDTVEVGLSIAKGFLACCHNFSFPNPKLAPMIVANINRLLDLLSNALQTLVLRLINLMDNGQKALKTWAKAFAKSLEVLEMLATFDHMDVRILVPVADALSTSLISGNWHASSANSSLKALSAIANRVREGNGDAERAIRKSILRLIPQISHSRYTKDSLAFFALCDLLSNTSQVDLVSACRVLKSMNAMKSTKLDSPDLDQRIEALNELNAMIKKGLSVEGSTVHIRKNTRDGRDVAICEQYVPCSADALIALFCGAFAAVRSDDTAIRGNAGYCIALMAKWAACSDCTGVKQLRIHIFESLVSATVKSRDNDSRREYCRALGEFVRSSSLPQHVDDDGLLILPIMKGLSSSTDVNVDVFENLVHLQAHRRGRAIRDVEKCLSSFRERQLDEDKQTVIRYAAFVKEFSLPLALNMALELVEKIDPQSRVRQMKGFQAKESSRRDVGLWAVSLAGESTRLLDWENYKTCLGDFLRRLRTETRENVRNVLFKLLVKISDAYPRYEEDSVEYIETSTYLADVVLPRMLQYVTAGAVEGDVIKDSSRQGDNRNRPGALAFHAPVAIAITQLMIQLPPAKIDTLIPLLVTPMTNALRSRRSGIRDSAKKALTSVVLILGPKYLGYVIQQVLSGLTEGFRRDNCVFVVYSVLSGVLDDKSRRKGRYSLDGIYDVVADFLIEELKCGIDDTKKEYEDPNASVSRQRQSSFRAVKACECAQVISANITFQDHAEAFCRPYINLLANASSSKLFHRVEECWRHIILGFSRNSSMVLEDSFIFCYKLVRWEPGAVIPQPTSKEAGKHHDEEHQQMVPSSYNHRICKLGMQFLSSILVKNWPAIMEKTAYSRKLQAMCEPFLPFIVKALNSGRDDLTLIAFKITQRMLKLPLPGRIEMGKSLSDTIVNVLSYGSNAISNTGIAETDDNLFITCLRSAAVLLSEVGTKNFTVVSRERVEALITISCECIDSGGPEVRVAALSVLRSLVVGQVIIPKLYDAIEKVNHIAIHCQSRQLRDACTNLSITFLVSFPLGSKRVRQHLEFFVRNLSYELAAGRLAALNAIHAVLNKFPGDALERKVNTFLWRWRPWFHVIRTPTAAQMQAIVFSFFSKSFRTGGKYLIF